MYVQPHHMHEPHSVLHLCLDSLLCFAMPLRCTGLGPPFRAQRERSCMPQRIVIIIWLFNEP